MTGSFGMTGSGTIAAAWLLAVAVFVLVVVRWTVLGRAGWRYVAARIVALLLVPILLAAAVGLTVNRQGLWFVSWRDLGSIVTGPNAGSLREHGADPRAAAGADLGAWGAEDNSSITVGRPVTDPHTPLTTYRVRGAASGFTGEVHVWRAPGGPTKGPRPVIELFHGYPVSAQSAFTNLGMAKHVSTVTPGAIVIVPDWSPREVDTECVDGPQVRMETWLTEDVPAWAVSTLGADPDRGSWAAFGYSAGGWCAAALAMRHPDTYSAAISLGGAARPEFSGPYKPVPTLGGPYDLPRLAAENPPTVAVLTQFSQRDAYAAPSSNALVAAARAPRSVTAWDTPDTGHRVGAWEPLVPAALTWLTRTAPGFDPDR